MTQEAGEESMLGNFEHESTLIHAAIRAEMVHEKGRYWMKLTDAQAKEQKLEIVRTVGSRRIQQYLTRKGDRWFRLPVAHDLVQRRWMQPAAFATIATCRGLLRRDVDPPNARDHRPSPGGNGPFR